MLMALTATSDSRGSWQRSVAAVAETDGMTALSTIHMANLILMHPIILN